MDEQRMNRKKENLLTPMEERLNRHDVEVKLRKFSQNHLMMIV